MPKDFKGQATGTEFQTPGQHTKRFRIAFSFAGEKRGFVAKVAAILAAEFTKKAILYDKFHEAEFGRRDLGIYLPEIYQQTIRAHRRRDMPGLRNQGMVRLGMDGYPRAAQEPQGRHGHALPF